jgi:hypothetical protein
MGNLKSDQSCISDPKSETSDWTQRDSTVVRQSKLRFRDFGFEMQDSSDFAIFRA